jgi:hypothetical protein
MSIDKSNINKVKIGKYAGFSNQGSNAIAIGYNSGYTNQSDNSISIGYNTSAINSYNSIVIGTDASSKLDISNQLIIGGIYANNISRDNLFVGVNMNNPLYTLDISGNTNIITDLYVKGTIHAFLDISGNHWDLCNNNIYNANSDNVGISTMMPTAKLDVNGNVKIRDNLDMSNSSIKVKYIVDKTDSSGTDGYYLTKTSDGIEWVAGSGGSGTGDLYWNANGSNIYNNNISNVGIGTTTPTAKLDISGNVKIRGILDMSNSIIREVSGIYFNDGTYVGHGNSFDISSNEIIKINRDKLVIHTNGNVGVNVSNPSYTLDVSGGTLKVKYIVDRTDTSGSNGQYLSKSANGIQWGTVNQYWDICNNNIYNNNVGNVGVGTSIPISKLDVSGNVKIRGILDMSNNILQEVSGIYFSDGSYTGHGSSFDISSNETIKINNNMLVINTDGNIGIGKTNTSYNLDVLNSIKTDNLNTINIRRDGNDNVYYFNDTIYALLYDDTFGGNALYIGGKFTNYIYNNSSNNTNSCIFRLNLTNNNIISYGFVGICYSISPTILSGLPFQYIASGDISGSPYIGIGNSINLLDSPSGMTIGYAVSNPARTTSYDIWIVGDGSIDMYKPSIDELSAFATVDGDCYCVISFTDSNIDYLFVGGDFTAINGVSANNIAKWDSDTEMWTDIGGLNGPCYTIEQYDNKIYVGGDFTEAGGVTVNNIAKWDINTSIWSSLGDGLDGSCNIIKINNNIGYTNYLYIGGHFSNADDISANSIVRYDIISESWANLSYGIQGMCRTIAIDNNNKLYVGGDITYAGSADVSNIGIYDINTDKWDYPIPITFNPNTNVDISGDISSISYNTTGIVHTLSITQDTIVVIEAWGAGGISTGTNGGRGGYSKTTINATTGNEIKIVVGNSGDGGNGGTSSFGAPRNGGNGGGASYIYYGSGSSYELKAVAGGGGGSGGENSGASTSGTGGNSQSNGANGGSFPDQPTGGTGATISSAGIGGTNKPNGNGTGGSGTGPMSLIVSSVTTSLANNGGNGTNVNQTFFGGGGGGGNGYYGGGSGGYDRLDSFCEGAGGGGGSNYGDTTLTDGTTASSYPGGSISLPDQDGYVKITLLNILINSDLTVYKQAFKPNGNDWDSISDIRMKTDIAQVNNQYLKNIINDFPLYNYKWNTNYLNEYPNEPTDIQYGTIAQDILILSHKYPELKQCITIINKTIDGTEYNDFHILNPSQFIFILTGTLKELIKERNEFNQQIDNISNIIEQYENK